MDALPEWTVVGPKALDAYFGTVLAGEVFVAPGLRQPTSAEVRQTLGISPAQVVTILQTAPRRVSTLDAVELWPDKTVRLDGEAVARRQSSLPLEITTADTTIAELDWLRRLYAVYDGIVATPETVDLLEAAGPIAEALAARNAPESITIEWSRTALRLQR